LGFRPTTHATFEDKLNTFSSIHQYRSDQWKN
jgi:hypothetical protein